MTTKDKEQLLSENVNWRACVEQVVLLMHARKDPDLGEMTVKLIRWLEDPRNVRKTQVKTLDGIINELRGNYDDSTEIDSPE